VKKIAISLVTSVFALLAAGTSHAQSAVLCIDFVNFCDGLQLQSNAEPPTLSGIWANWDCAGTDQPVFGGFTSEENFRVFCTTAGCPIDLSWMFIIDAFGLGFTFDLWGLNPPFPQQQNQPYTVSAGECPFTGTEKGTLPSWMR
jgi:hypothetical protein